jgi:F-box domain
MDSMEYLPDRCLRNIFGHFNKKDLMQTCLVSKKFNRFSRLFRYSIYCFKKENLNYYGLKDGQCSYLNFREKVESISKQTFQEIKHASFSDQLKLSIFQSVLILSGFGMSTFSKFINIDEKTNSENEEINELYNYMLSSFAYSALINGLFYAKLGYNILSSHKKTNTVFSQKIYQLIPHVKDALYELKHEIYPTVDLWHKIEKMKDDEAAITYLEVKIREGVCLGYVIALLDQLHAGSRLHGSELICKMNLKTAVKKQLIANIYNSIGNELERNIKNSDALTLNQENAETIVLKDTYRDLYRMLYQIKGAFRMNNAFPYIKVTKGAKAIEKYFLNHLIYTSFMPFTQIDALNKNKTIQDCFEIKDFIPGEKDVSRFDHGDFVAAKEERNKFVFSNSRPMNADTILAGEITLSNNKDFNHALYFRLSNGIYHLFDSNHSFSELSTLEEFFQHLYSHIDTCYGEKGMSLKFVVLAIQAEKL